MTTDRKHRSTGLRDAQKGEELWLRSEKAVRARAIVRMRSEATDLERRAASLAFQMATLDDERARCLAKAAVLRMEAER